MKRIFNLTGIVALFATVSMLVSSCSQPMSPDAPPQTTAQHNALTVVKQAQSTMTVNNQSSENTSFTFTLSDQTQQVFPVPAYQLLNDQTQSPIVAVNMNGTVIPANVKVIVKMSDGKYVAVTWSQTDNVIAVTDTIEMN